MADALVPVNLDPDGLTCYSDHAHDIKTRGQCDLCGSSEVNVTGHVMPDVPRRRSLDPVEAATLVSQEGARIIDGVLLDGFSASAVLAVHKALNPVNQARLRAMTLTTAVTVCFRLAAKT